MKLPTRMRGKGPDSHPGEDTRGWLPPEVRAAWERLPEPVRRLVLPLALVVLAFFYPKHAESLPGAFPGVGALVIGFVQAFNEGLTWYTPGSDWTRSIVFGLLIAILVFRPEGLLGERTPEGQ